MRALVTGATGFIGRRLVRSLERPVVLTRKPDPAKKILGDVEAICWEPESGPPTRQAFRGVVTVFHLAGEPVAEGRWSSANEERPHSGQPRFGNAQPGDGAGIAPGAPARSGLRLSGGLLRFARR